ncbi:MAG: glycosyltransferase family 2 protein [Candidatus Schekmanbacteria bacterium]|nr:glycosyltransferase family 2 protein [Candidatus Schekmanbacteria bacterium]
MLVNHASLRTRRLGARFNGSIELPGEPETPAAPEVSVVIPAYNESENLAALIPATCAVLERAVKDFEIVVVDDGSADSTFAVLRKLKERHPQLVALRLMRNYGQTAALAAGLDASRGTWVVTMDGDLQNDPDDIPRLLAKAAEGYDVVSGWRKDRQDAYWSRTLPSNIANAMISRVTGVRLHDYGCTLKVYRGDIVRSISLYGELHRFIPALTSWLGARIAELPVNHRPRISGRSNYGIGRVFKVILDVITVKFLLRFARHPSRIFGGFGLLALVAGTVCAILAVAMKIFMAFNLNRNPLLYVMFFSFTVGFQFILMGLLAELVIRTYYESSGSPTYHIREVLD